MDTRIKDIHFVIFLIGKKKKDQTKIQNYIS